MRFVQLKYYFFFYLLPFFTLLFVKKCYIAHFQHFTAVYLLSLNILL